MKKWNKRFRDNCSFTMKRLGSLASLLLAACTTGPEPDLWNTEKATVEASIQMAGTPRRLVVLINGEYVGTTPMTLKVPAHADRKWTHDATVLAQTPGDVGSWVFHYKAGDKIPERLFFNIPLLSPSEYQAVYGSAAP